MKTTLLIMAAGIGSRFGTGIKQLERKSSNMGTGYEKSPHFAGIEKIL